MGVALSVKSGGADLALGPQFADGLQAEHSLRGGARIISPLSLQCSAPCLAHKTPPPIPLPNAMEHE